MTVGLCAPASHLFEPAAYAMAEERIRSLGFIPRLSPEARSVRGYLAGEDAARARDLNGLFADPEVDAVWCLRGGYGCLRMLPHVDFDIIRSHPKPLIGFSDITVLHLAIQKMTGLVTFHGPMPGSDFSAYTRSELERVVMTPAVAGVIGVSSVPESARGAVEPDARCLTLHGGRERGRLTGGNLTLLTRLLGTPFEPALDGRILFLEDTGEAVYRIDGMLSQLRLAGKLASCAGIVFGRFTKVDRGEPSVAVPLVQVLEELTADLGVPVLSGLPIGHVDDQTVVPYGVMAELDADGGTLALLEPAVQ